MLPKMMLQPFMIGSLMLYERCLQFYAKLRKRGAKGDVQYFAGMEIIQRGKA
jgi:hypothetical protein